MASDTVRIKPETHAKLRNLAKASGRSMPDVLEEAVEVLRRQRLLDDTSRAFAALRRDDKAWKAELAERELWATTLGDDLKDN